MSSQTSFQKKTAQGFLIMGISNVLAALLFLGAYLADGNIWYLVICLVFVAATGGLLFLQSYVRRKFPTL